MTCLCTYKGNITPWHACAPTKVILPHDMVCTYKSNITPWHACAPTKDSRKCSSNPFSNLASEMGGWTAPHSNRFTTSNDPVHIVQYKRLGGSRDRSERAGKTWPPPYFGLLTFQRVTSCCTGYVVLTAAFVRKGEAILSQTWTDPKGSSRMRLPVFKTICAWRW